MSGTHWMRIVLCGLVAGVVWFVLSAALLALFAQGLVAAVQTGGPHPQMGGAYFFAIDLLMGVWAVWLYSALEPRYGAGLRTAAITGIGWWSIKSLQSAKWVGFGFVPPEVVLVPLATTAVAAITASLVGGWLYHRVEMPLARARS